MVCGCGAFGHTVQNAQALVQPDPAGDAFATRLGVSELDEIAGDVDHAIVFIHHDHAAGAHDGSELRQVLVVDCGVEHILRNTSTRGAAGLNGLDLASPDGAFADVVNESLQRCAQWHLDQAGIFHFADEREDLGSRALGTTGFGEPGWTAHHDGRDVVPSLDVVNIRRLSPKSFLSRKWRTGTRSAGFAFERGNQSSFLTADECARAFDQFDIELKSTAENVFSQQAVLAGLFDGSVETMHRQRILGAHVDDSFGCAHHVPTDDHALEQGVRVALDLVPVHIGAGIAFVGVADDVLRLGLGFGEEFPFVASKVTGASTSAKLGDLDLFDYAARVGIDQNFVECLITADRDVFFDVVRIDDPAIAQNDFLLAFKKGDFAPGRHFRISSPVTDVAGNVIPFFDLAIDKVGSEVALGDVMQKSAGVVALYFPKNNQRVARQMDADQRFLKASAKAAHWRQYEVISALLDCL